MRNDKKILDATCGFRGMWFNKNHPNAIYVDRRDETHQLCDERVTEIKPDIIADFTDLPFEDNTFYLVVFDPPHLTRLGESSWMAKKYGYLLPTWEADIKGGFDECMRVLKPNGVLIFKWNELDISTEKVLSVIQYEPLFGHTTSKHGKTKWMTFMKL